MKVSVIESDGTVVTTGEWDGRRVQGEYAKVSGELYHCAYVYLAEHQNEIVAALKDTTFHVKEAEKRHMRTLMDMGNKYRARP